MSDDLRAALAPFLREIAEINDRNNFAPGRERPAADNARFRALWAEADRIVAEHDAAHPLPPCPSCGRERRASWGGGCISFGACPEAPRAMGG